MESKGRLVIIAVVGVIVAFGAITVYKRVVSSDAAPLVEKEQVNDMVLIADRDLVAGSFVDITRDVRWEKVDPASITADQVTEQGTNLASYNGAVVRRNLRAGDRVTQDVLMKSGEGGFMSAVLEPGHRAVSISVNATSGNAGFISPGDKVDLIVTRRIRVPSGGGNDEQVVSETFVRNVRVLAVDQALDNPENVAILAKTVTLEVSTKQAEQIAVATELGRISLALRSMVGEAQTAEQPAPATPDEAVAQVYSDAPAPTVEHMQSDVSRIRVIRGDEVENLEMQ